MAKPIGPLLSIDAHGQIGKALCFSVRKSGQLVRNYHKPTGKRTGDQLAQREIIAGLTAYWKTFSASQKLVYENLAKENPTPMTGFNMWIRMACADLSGKYGLRVFIPFEDVRGNIQYDQSGYSNNFTNAGLVNLTDGVIGKCAKFTGISGNEHLYCDHAFGITTTFSVALWVKVNSNAVPTGFEYIYSGSIAQNYIAQWQVGVGRILSSFYIGGVNRTVATNAGLTVGKWNHIVILYDGNKLKVYKNAVLDSQTGTISGAVSGLNDAGRKYIGKYLYADTKFNGDIDDLRIYNRALEVAEMQAIIELVRK